MMTVSIEASSLTVVMTSLSTRNIMPTILKLTARWARVEGYCYSLEHAGMPYIISSSSEKCD